MVVPPTRYPVIVTKSVKGVYQNPTYMNATLTPKISLANKANLINQVAAPTKAVNQKTPVIKFHTQPQKGCVTPLDL